MKDCQQNFFKCGAMAITSILISAIIGSYGYATWCKTDNRQRIDHINENISQKFDKLDTRIDGIDRNIVEMATQIKLYLRKYSK